MIHRMESRGFRKVIALCLAAFLLTGSMVQIKPVLVQAATVEDEKDKINDLKGEKEELESEVAKIDKTISTEEEKQEEYLGKIAEAREQIASYQGQIDDVNLEIGELNDKIDDLNKQIEEATKQIEKKQKEIKQKELEIEETNEKFKSRLSAMYMISGDFTVMNVLLGAESFSDFLTQSQILKNISNNDNQLMDELEAYKTDLQELKTEMETFKTELEDHKGTVEKSKEEVEDKKQSIVSLQKSEEEKENEMNALQAESQKIIDKNEEVQAASAEEIARIEAEIEEAEANIDYLIQQAEEERRQEEERKNQEKEEADNEDGGEDSDGDSGEGDDDSDDETADIPSSSGWTHPCPNYSYISTYFAVTDAWHTTHKHGGVDFAAGSGNNIYASRSGTVVDAIWGWGGGYGNHLLLSHGDGYYTLYAHCSSLSVSAGDTVSQGQVIASVGSTGNSTGPHLHFEVRQGSTKLDPLNFL